VKNGQAGGATASAAAGAENLLAWQKQQAIQPTAEGLAGEEFRRALVAEVGPNPTASQLGLISAACATFEALELAHRRIRRRRKRNALSLVETISQLSGNLRRTLEQLGLADADPLLPADVANTLGEQPEPTLQELVRGTADEWTPPTWAQEIEQTEGENG
jgi:hypothetical protein